MPQTGLIYRVLIASPSDAIQERKAIPEVLALWNTLNSWRSAAILEPVMWETHARPELGDRPQAIINKQLIGKCDFLVGAFWTKLGTHTGEAESGTVEEIDNLRAAGKPTLLYFSALPVVLESVDAREYERLREYKQKMRSEGIFFSYESIADFREMLLRHVGGTMHDLLARDLGAPARVEPEADAEANRTQQAFQSFKDNFSSFLRRLRAEWVSERDSGPYSTDEGRSIMFGARTEVVNFLSQIEKDPQGRLTGALQGAMSKIRQLEKHRTMMDGGISFGRFWELGDEVLDALGEAESIVEQW